MEERVNRLCIHCYLKRALWSIGWHIKHLKVYNLIRFNLRKYLWNIHHNQEREEIRRKSFLAPPWHLASHPYLPSTHLQANINVLSASLVCILCDFIWMKLYIILFLEGGSLASFTRYGGNLCWNLLLRLISIVHCFLLLKGKHFVIWICIFLPQVASLSTCRKTFRLLDFRYYRCMNKCWYTTQLVILS